jgi:hypothetical protein
MILVQKSRFIAPLRQQLLNLKHEGDVVNLHEDNRGTLLEKLRAAAQHAAFGRMSLIHFRDSYSVSAGRKISRAIGQA